LPRLPSAQCSRVPERESSKQAGPSRLKKGVGILLLWGLSTGCQSFPTYFQGLGSIPGSFSRQKADGSSFWDVGLGWPFLPIGILLGAQIYYPVKAGASDTLRLFGHPGFYAADDHGFIPEICRQEFPKK